MKTVFFDIDTQIDFMYPAGSFYVPGASALIRRIAALNHFAASQGAPLVSTVDAHTENDPEFRLYPHHCVTGTVGQGKPQITLLDKRLTVPNVRLKVALSDSQQVLLEKQTIDCFTNVNLESLLEQWNAGRYIVYGVVTEICVRKALEGLLKTGREVVLVQDAVQSIDSAASAQMIAQMQTQGLQLRTAAQVMAA
ncbi:MAG: cysteine hydrolase [Bryobacterales bacterium]|nr:cysteine hydrolase [Bryobacterales bacterium]